MVNSSLQNTLLNYLFRYSAFAAFDKYRIGQKMIVQHSQS